MIKSLVILSLSVMTESIQITIKRDGAIYRSEQRDGYRLCWKQTLSWEDVIPKRIKYTKDEAFHYFQITTEQARTHTRMRKTTWKSPKFCLGNTHAKRSGMMYNVITLFTDLNEDTYEIVFKFGCKPNNTLRNLLRKIQAGDKEHSLFNSGNTMPCTTSDAKTLPENGPSMIAYHLKPKQGELGYRARELLPKCVPLKEPKWPVLRRECAYAGVDRKRLERSEREMSRSEEKKRCDVEYIPRPPDSDTTHLEVNASTLSGAITYYEEKPKPKPVMFKMLPEERPKEHIEDPFIRDVMDVRERPAHATNCSGAITEPKDNEIIRSWHN